MSIIEVRLFELRMKGERQGEIDAEEILNRRAVAQARAQARCLYLRRLDRVGKAVAQPVPHAEELLEPRDPRTALVGRRAGEEREVDGCTARGEPPESLGDYLGSAEFWFESLQNWQSEFLSLLAMVVLSIVLRERGSPQSKPVHAPHGETGG